MMQALSEKGNLRQLVEVFENERYIPISGWGKGLLPSDPNVFSSREGKTATKTIAEYESNLITSGWEFEENSDWAIAKSDVNVDEDGWSYSLDFNGFKKDKEEGELERSSVVLFDNDGLDPDSSENAPIDLVTMEALNRANATLSGVTPPSSPSRESRATNDLSPLHVYESKGSRDRTFATIVRRRRLTRWMIFHPFLLLSDEYSTATSLSNESIPPPNLTCDHCDYQELDKLAGALLKGLTEASLVAHPRYFDEIKLNKLKSAMLASLDLKQKHSDMADRSHFPEQAEGSSIENEEATSYSFEVIVSRLDSFIKSCKSGWATMSSSISGDSGLSPQEKRAKRESIVATYYYSYPERRAVAEMIIRGSDREFKFHCQERACGKDCRFAPHVCPHVGCDQTFSLVHLPEHDEVCVYKPVPCPRGCTEKICKPAKAHQSTDIEEKAKEGGDDCGTEVIETEQLCLFPRREIDRHMEYVCALRPVECPCAYLGCMAPDLRAKDLVYHLEECQISHSLLLMERIKIDSERIRCLEEQNNDMKDTIAFLLDSDARADTKVNAAVASLTATMTAQFATIRKETIDSKQAFNTVQSKVNDLAEKERQLESNQKNEKERINNELRRVADALKAQKSYTQSEFMKIAQAAQERRNRNGK